jgi:hypothetical protein
MGMDTLRREARDAQSQAAEFKMQAESFEKASVEARRKVWKSEYANMWIGIVGVNVASCCCV